MKFAGIYKDYLYIEYRGNDKLYVPTDQIDLIQKYVASGEKEPTLHKLGGAAGSVRKVKFRRPLKILRMILSNFMRNGNPKKGHAFRQRR